MATGPSAEDWVALAEESVAERDWSEAARAFRVAAEAYQERDDYVLAGIAYIRSAHAREQSEDWRWVCDMWRDGGNVLGQDQRRLEVVPPQMPAGVPSWERLCRIWTEGTNLLKVDAAQAKRRFAFVQGECYMWAGQTCEQHSSPRHSCLYYAAAAQCFKLARGYEGAVTHEVQCLVQACLSYIGSEGTLAHGSLVRPARRELEQTPLQARQGQLEDALDELPAGERQLSARVSAYRELRSALEKHGSSAEASRYYLRQMRAQLDLARSKRQWTKWTWLRSCGLLCSYGESPHKWALILGAFVAIVFPLSYVASGYLPESGLVSGHGALQLSHTTDVARAMYFSLAAAVTGAAHEIAGVTAQGLANVILLFERAFCLVMLGFLGGSLFQKWIHGR